MTVDMKTRILIIIQPLDISAVVRLARLKQISVLMLHKVFLNIVKTYSVTAAEEKIVAFNNRRYLSNRMFQTH